MNEVHFVAIQVPVTAKVALQHVQEGMCVVSLPPPGSPEPAVLIADTCNHSACPVLSQIVMNRSRRYHLLFGAF